MDERFKKLSEETVFEGDFLKMRRAIYRIGDTGTTRREYVVHPGAVTVVPVLQDGRALTIWQFRVPVGREVFEVCAGKRDLEGEPPATTAERELEEELGLAAAKIVHLGMFYNSPGFCNEETQIYLAVGLRDVGRNPQGLEEEAMRLASVEIERIPWLAAHGVLTDAKTYISLEFARTYLASPEGSPLLGSRTYQDDPSLDALFPAWLC